MEPVPRMVSRPGGDVSVLDTYWKFAAERQAIFERRVQGLPAPWTTDQILHEYKFCCTYRAADRVSQHLIRQLYAEPNASKADLAFRAVAYRTFSMPAAWDRLVGLLGHQPRLSDLQDGGFTHALETVRAAGTLYTTAFIVPPVEGFEQKHHGHIDLFTKQFIAKEAGDRVAEAGSLETVYNILHGFPFFGDFLAMQMAIDVNYSTATDFSENDFIHPGPGAMRGIEKVFKHTLGWSPRRIIDWMVERQAAEFERLGLRFNGLWGRPLHAIDAQGLFCETDKYSRVAFPELASNRKKIKTKFPAPTPEPIELFFPPKWGINDRLPRGKVLGTQAVA